MNWLLVACGGAIGATLRYAASLLLKPHGLFPWPTWWVNLLGCFCAGLFLALCQKYPALQQETRLFLMVGILGGFTTFSSFGLETFQLLRHGQHMLTLLYVLSTLFLGGLVLALGFYLAQYLLASKSL